MQTNSYTQSICPDGHYWEEDSRWDLTGSNVCDCGKLPTHTNVVKIGSCVFDHTTCPCGERSVIVDENNKPVGFGVVLTHENKNFIDIIF